MKQIFIPAFIIFTCMGGCENRKPISESAQIADALITLGNEEFTLAVKQRGGAYVDFHLIEKPVNPFTWKLEPGQMPQNNQPFTFDGHFLCIGRWGEPSPGEINAGIPHNGEVNTGRWEISGDKSTNGFDVKSMNYKAPIEQIDVVRNIYIPEQGTYFLVREWFTNQLPVGRVHNVVQHGTIAAPFLTQETIINTNATLGFDQRTNYKYLEDSSFSWPDGYMADGSVEDLRRVTSENGYVTTHIFDDSIGWITAINPEEHLVMGYIWKTAAYPWINVWHQPKDGKPFVQGLEFGTTGLGKPYQLLLENNVSFFGRNSFEYIDAGQTIEKSWVCFMVIIPEGFGEVVKLSLNSKAITLQGTDQKFLIQGDFSQISGINNSAF